MESSEQVGQSERSLGGFVEDLSRPVQPAVTDIVVVEAGRDPGNPEDRKDHQPPPTRSHSGIPAGDNPTSKSERPQDRSVPVPPSEGRPGPVERNFKGEEPPANDGNGEQEPRGPAAAAEAQDHQYQDHPHCGRANANNTEVERLHQPNPIDHFFSPFLI